MTSKKDRNKLILSIILFFILIITNPVIAANFESIENNDYLVTYWSFDEGAGDTIHDSSGNGFDGVISGANWISGYLGNALEFSDTSDIVTSISGSLDDYISDYLSIECWVYWSGNGSDLNTYIFDCRSGIGANGRGFFFYINADHKLKLVLQTPSGQNNITGLTNIQTNEWTHVKGIFNHYDNTLNLYVNDVLDNSKSYSMPYYDSSYSKAIGNNRWAPSDSQWRKFNGIIDELKIYNRINNPPIEPLISGESEGKAKDEYNYNFVTLDPEDDTVYYYIDWGDNSSENWLGPYSSGESINVAHIWDEQGYYTIRAKAKDIYGLESNWTELEVSMPKSKISDFQNNISIEFRGGFGLTIIIKNNGDTTIPILEFILNLDAPWLILGGETTSTISDIAPGMEEIITTGFLFGFGSFHATVNVLDLSESRSGFMFGPFVILF
jgi:hypothetical protein